MFSYAASYFGNADAQYDLARLYLKGAGASRGRFPLWRALARPGRAEGPASGAGACSARCCSTATSCRGSAARGLMWLTLARDSATPDEAWIKESYNRAIAKASDDDRAMALQMLEHWVQGRKD